MSLETYQHKRDFRKTTEPSGRDVPPLHEGLLFVVQKHKARRLHYDLRLELDGVLKSWAVPKGPSTNPQDKRLAVRVEDHPLDYADFEGVIPEGEYGAGSVLVWDRGTWEPEGGEDPRRALDKGVLKFRLHGSKLEGSWAIARMGGSGGENWLLIKHRDTSATNGSGKTVVDRYPESVQSRRTIEQVAAASGEAFSHGVRFSRLPGARPAPEVPEDVKPELATLVESAPEGEEWLHEIKYDGYRILAFKQGGRVRLASRNAKDWTARFHPVAKVLQDAAGDAVLDGEVVVLDESGRSSFQSLQQQLKGLGRGRLVYFVFDLLWYQGHDLRGVPLAERKAVLRHMLQESFPDPDSTVRFSDHQEGKGGVFFRRACAAGVEGVVSKRFGSLYIGKRTRDWVKVKCARRQEFVVGGFTEPAGSRVGFGALLLGYYDAGGKLRYAGRVGTGFDDATLTDLHRKLLGMEASAPPFADPPARREARTATWVKPVLVAEVTFTEWTDDGRLRHPTFQGLREDKDPGDIRREEAAAGEAPEEPGDVPGDGILAARPGRRAAPQGEPPPRTSSRPGTRTHRVPVRGSRKSPPGSVEIAGMVITHPDRPVFPDAGVTKGEVARFYASVAPLLLPHIAERPLSVVRCPEGRSKQCFFQKHHAARMPDAVGAVRVSDDPEDELYLTVDSVKGLVALAQFGVLEIHPWLARNDRLDRPDRMIFDLDPGEEVAWEEVLGAAFLLRDLLGRIGLRSFPKLTGGKGFHLVVPLQRQLDFATVKAAAKAIAGQVYRANPARFLLTATKAKRGGKIYLDYLRNGQGATAIAPYSLRARSGAPVAVPIRWEEVQPGLKPDAFTIGSLPELLERGDPWADFAGARRQILPSSALRDLGVR